MLAADAAAADAEDDAAFALVVAKDAEEAAEDAEPLAALALLDAAMA